MPNYRALVAGGFFARPDDKTLPVSIRSNNPGAVNGASWERSMPGYVTEIKYDGKNNTTVFETPEHGVAVYYTLLKKYRAVGAVTVRDIIWKYGGGQANYTAYAQKVAEWTGLSLDQEIALHGSDDILLKFAKAMFRYEAGRDPPWLDAQIRYGFALARGEVQHNPKVPEPRLGPSVSIPALMAIAIAGLLHLIASDPIFVIVPAAVVGFGIWYWLRHR